MLQVFRLYPLAGGGALKYLTQKWCVEKVKSPRRSLELLKFVKYSDYSLGCHMNEGRVREDVPGKHQKGSMFWVKFSGGSGQGNQEFWKSGTEKTGSKFRFQCLALYWGSHWSIHVPVSGDCGCTTIGWPPCQNPLAIWDTWCLLVANSIGRHFSPPQIGDPPKKPQNWITEKTWVDLNFPVKFN